MDATPCQVCVPGLRTRFVCQVCVPGCEVENVCQVQYLKIPYGLWLLESGEGGV